MEERGGGLGGGGGGGRGGGGMQGPSGFYVVAPHFNTKLMVRPPPPHFEFTSSAYARCTAVRRTSGRSREWRILLR